MLVLYSGCGHGACCLVMVTLHCHVGVAVISGWGVGHDQLSMAVGGHQQWWVVSAVGGGAELRGSRWGMVVVEEQAM